MLSELPPLHPERIRGALRAIEMARDDEEKVFSAAHVESFRAALELVRKGQLAMGLSGNVVESGRALLAFMDAVSKQK